MHVYRRRACAFDNACSKPLHLHTRRPASAIAPPAPTGIAAPAEAAHHDAAHAPPPGLCAPVAGVRIMYEGSG
eukprot:1160775-Pelagomonas_calceolata.AAC.11